VDLDAGRSYDGRVADAVDRFTEELLSLCGPELADVTRDAIAAARRDARLDRLIDAELESRRAPARAAFVSCYRARFGVVPVWLESKLDVLDRDTLALARALVETSPDVAGFASRWEVLEAACIENRLAGARRVLAEFLRQRYGWQISYDYEDLLALATAHELDACFHRLATASSLEEVIEPVLSRLESRRRER
jgi:hypothetical protein